MRQDFENQEAYEYWRDRDSNKVKYSHEKQQERIREKLRNYKDYNEFLGRMDHHREKNFAREHLMRGEGFKHLNYKYGLDYNFYQNVETEHQPQYNLYRERFYERYWDTKENHEYYS